MNKCRNTYIPSDMLEKTPWIKYSELVSNVNGLTQIKTESDYTITNVMKMLFVLGRQKLSFSDLCVQSGFRMKLAYLKYLKFCQELGFIEKTTKDGLIQPYKITKKGRVFLELFS